MTLTDRITARLKAELGEFTSPAKCERIIRIVLEGIREPTEAMINAGAAKVPGYLEGWPGEREDFAADILCAMIDAALSPEEVKG